MDILFVDQGRQDEIELFYEACQRHRDYYRGYAKAHHPLIYFRDPEYTFQCPSEMTVCGTKNKKESCDLPMWFPSQEKEVYYAKIMGSYLSFPMYHVKYKQPLVLPSETGRTSNLPALPDRTLAARYNKAACKAYIR